MGKRERHAHRRSALDPLGGEIEEAEGVVESERAHGFARIAFLVGRAHDPAPAALGPAREIRLDRVRAGLPGPLVVPEHAPSRTDQAHVDGRGPHELVGEALVFGRPVAVRRDDLCARDRGIGPEVHDHERVRYRSLRAVGRHVENVAVERERRAPAAVERVGGDGVQPTQLERELAHRHPGAARAAPVDGHEQDPPVGPLSNGRSRMPLQKQVRAEALARWQRDPPLADERRASADRVGDLLPPRLQDELHDERRPRQRERLEARSAAAGGLQNRPALGNRGASPAPYLHDLPGEVDVHAGRRQPRDDDVHRTTPPGCRGAPDRCEETDLRANERPVQLVERRSRRLTDAPGAEEADLRDAQQPVEPYAERGTAARRTTVQRPVAYEDAGGVRPLPAEEVAVDGDAGRGARQASLHLGHRLGAGDRPVREHRNEAIERTWLRGGDDVDEHLFPAHDALEPLVRHARHQLARCCRRAAERGREGGDECRNDPGDGSRLPLHPETTKPDASTGDNPGILFFADSLP